jgi:hypothetical protein
MFRVPVREEVPVLVPTKKVTAPFPDPFAPEVIKIQETPLVAVHEQLLEVYTFTFAYLAAAPNDKDPAETE